MTNAERAKNDIFKKYGKGMTPQGVGQTTDASLSMQEGQAPVKTTRAAEAALGIIEKYSKTPERRAAERAAQITDGTGLTSEIAGADKLRSILPEVMSSPNYYKRLLDNLNTQIKEKQKSMPAPTYGGTFIGSSLSAVTADAKDRAARAKEIKELKEQRSAMLNTYYELSNRAAQKNIRKSPDDAEKYLTAVAAEKDADKIAGVMTRVAYIPPEGYKDWQTECRADEDCRYIENKYGISVDGKTMPEYLDALSALLAEKQNEEDKFSKLLDNDGYNYKRLRRYETDLEKKAELEKYREDMAKLLEKPGTTVLANTISLLNTPLKAIEGVGAMLSTVGHNDPEDYESYVPMNNYHTEMRATEFGNIIRGGTAQKIEQKTDSKLLSFLYQTGMSAVDSAAMVYTLGPFATVAFGGSAAADYIDEKAGSGATNGQIITGALAAGTAEAAFEYLSVENLLKARDINKVGDILKAVIEQSGVEASEEMFTEISNIISDALIMGDYSDRSDAIRRYKAAGLTDKEAKQRVFFDNLKQVGLAGAGGAISGGLMGGAHTTVSGWTSVTDNARINRELGRIYAPGARELIDEGLQSGKKTESYRQAARLEEKLQKGKKLSFAELGQLVRANQQAIENERAAQTEDTDDSAPWEHGIVLPRYGEVGPGQELEWQDITGRIKEAAAKAAESTAVNDDPARHTQSEQLEIEAYKAQADPSLAAFIERVRETTDQKHKNSMRADIRTYTNKAAAKAAELTGVDTTGYKNIINGSTVQHIDKRHGSNGAADKSLADINDFARIGFVLDNFKDARLLQYDEADAGAARLTNAWKNNDNTPAPLVQYSMPINGIYYVVEAVPVSKAKVMAVVSAYITGKKSSTHNQVLSLPEDPTGSVTPEARLDMPSATENNIPQTVADVNTAAKTQRYKLHEVLTTNKNGAPLFQSESGENAGPLRSDAPSGRPYAPPITDNTIALTEKNVNMGGDDINRAAKTQRNDESILDAASDKGEIIMLPRYGENMTLPTVGENDIIKKQKGATSDGGGDVLNGNEGRNAGESAGEQARRMAEGTGRTADRADAGRRAAEARGITEDLRIVPQSTREIGFYNGTETKSMKFIPSENETSWMKAMSQKVKNDLGVDVRYYTGRMQIAANNERGYVTPNAAIKNGVMYIQADNPRWTIEQLAEHESFHELARRKPEIFNTARNKVLKKYSAETFTKTMNSYIANLRALDYTADQYVEEILADAYAGMNAFEAGAQQYQDVVRGTVSEMMKPAQTAAATETTTGPPADTQARLARLREDLRNGAITDEEFDEQYDLLSTEEDAQDRENFSVSRIEDPEQKRRVVEQLRKYINGGMSMSELRGYINGAADAETNTERTVTENTEADEIVRAARRRGMSVREYVNENWDYYEQNGRPNAAVQEAIDRERGRFSVTDEDDFNTAINMLDNGAAATEVFNETGLVVMANGNIRDGIAGEIIGRYDNGRSDEGTVRLGSETTRSGEVYGRGDRSRMGGNTAAESGEKSALTEWDSLTERDRREIISAVSDRMAHASDEGLWLFEECGSAEAFAERFYSMLRQGRIVAEQWTSFIPDAAGLMDEIESISEGMNRDVTRRYDNGRSDEGRIRNSGESTRSGEVYGRSDRGLLEKYPSETGGRGTLAEWNSLAESDRRRITSAVSDRMARARAEGAELLDRCGSTEAFTERFYSMLRQGRVVAEQWVNIIPDAVGLMDKIESISSERYSIDDTFRQEVQEWLDNTQPEDRITDGGYFRIGTTSEPLKNMGMRDGNVYWRKHKIGSILQEHAEISGETIKAIPEILEQPIVVLKSLTRPDSVVLFGDVFAENGDKVMAALALTPRAAGNMEAEFSLLTSAYGRTDSNISNLLKKSEYLYTDKNRADEWLKSLGVQFPSDRPVHGSIGTISYDGKTVNIHGKTFKELGGFELGEGIMLPTASDRASERYSIDETFADEIDEWDGKTAKTFNVGTTSEALQSIGVDDRRIIWRSGKIGDILAKHDGMTREVIKQVPNILENPVIVMQSRNSDSRLTMFGEVYDENDVPVLAVLELQPTNRGGELLDLNVIASAYGKDSNAASFIQNSKILYLDQNKNRTDMWLQGLGLRLPSDTAAYGSIGNVSYADGKVNIRGRTFKELGGFEIGGGIMLPTASDRASERYSIDETDDGRKYVKADRQVIFGNDPASWSEQLENYINSKIRHDQNVQLIAEDGDILTLTKRTAGKISSRYNNDGTTMSDDYFSRKVSAGAHIDELVQVSRRGNKIVNDSNSKHGEEAAGGWNYRTAFFRDFDGKYYRCTISVEIGNDGNAVYNIGKIEERRFPAVQSALRGSSGNSGAQAEQSSSADYYNTLAENVKDIMLPTEEDFSVTDDPDDDPKKIKLPMVISRETLNKKAQNALRAAERRSSTIISKALDIPTRGVRDVLTPVIQQLSDEYLRDGRISQEALNDTFETAYEQGVVIDDEFVKEYAEVKSYLRKNGIKIEEYDTRDIPDYGTFKKSLFGRINISDRGLPIDVAYMELRDMAPGLFPEDITAPSDMLLHIDSVSRQLRASQKSLDEYYGPDAKMFKEFSRREFGEAVDALTADLRSIRSYAESKTAKPAERITTPEEAKEAWAKIKDARRLYEKVAAKNVLSERDEMQVGRLLKSEILPEDLNPKTDNVRGINAVYEAKKEYERLAQILRTYKAEHRQALDAVADKFLVNALHWQDKKSGLLYARETQERNIEDIVRDARGNKDPETAKKIQDIYFTPVQKSQAESNRYQEKMRERVENLKLSRKVKTGNIVSEAHAVQLLGEALDNIQMIEDSKGRIDVRDGKRLQDWRAIVQDLYEKNPNINFNKIQKAIEEFRAIYDELFEKMNEVRIRNGYEPINYRRGYFPHFQPGENGIFGVFSKALGISADVTALPTTINGLTHTFKPGITWFGHAQERLGFSTAYDAVEGFDKYLTGAADVIFQTDNIQRLRSLARRIRYNTSEDGIKKQVDDILQNPNLSEAEKSAMIDKVYEDGKFTLSNYIVDLEEYTNLLANKKSRADRNWEQALGRKWFNVAKRFESLIASNMVGMNVGSWLTNFIPLTQGGVMVGKTQMLAAMKDTLKAYVSDDGFVDRSTFLTNRRGTDPIVRSWDQHISSVIGAPMEVIDRFTADTLVRARYAQNIKKGMSEQAAMDEADVFASRVMADRSKGSMPTLFHRHNPMTKLVTQFQLEVNNQLGFLFKDMPRLTRDKGKGALVAALLQFFIGAFLYNEIYEYFIGRRAALDPIGILNETSGDVFGYELPNMVELGRGALKGAVPSLKTEKAGVYDSGVNLLENALEEMPFTAALGLLGIDIDAGRLPVSSALPDLTTFKTLVNTDVSKSKKIKEIKDEAYKALYLLPTGGGGQLKKAIQGLGAVYKGGSFTVDNDGNAILQYPVYTKGGLERGETVARAALFGKTALPRAGDWIDSGFKNLSANETITYMEMVESGSDGNALFDFIRELKQYGSQAEKANAIIESDFSASEKIALTDFLIGKRIKNGGKLTDRFETETDSGNDNQYAKFHKAIAAGISIDDCIRAIANGDKLDKITEAKKAGISVKQYSSLEDKGISVKQYKEKKDIGFSDDGVIKIIEAMDGVGNNKADRFSAIKKAGLSNKDFETAVREEFGASAYKLDVADDYDVDASEYVTFQVMLPKYDEDGNGSYRQVEIEAALRAMQGLTNEERAVLWQLQTGSTSSKNNPFNKSVGSAIVYAMAEAKGK